MKERISDAEKAFMTNYHVLLTCLILTKIASPASSSIKYLFISLVPITVIQKI